MPVPPSLRRLAVPAAACSLLAVGFTGGAATFHATQSGSHARDHSRAARPACPASDFTSTRAQLERAEDCETGRKVTELLRTEGYRDVHVLVTRTASDSLLGPAERLHVRAQVTEPTRDRLSRDPLLMQRSIAASVGTTPDLVEVVDESGVPLSTGSSGPSSPPSTPPR